MILRAGFDKIGLHPLRWAGVLLLLASLALPSLAAAEVRQVFLEVEFEGDGPHPLVRARLVATAQAVADRLLVGRPVDLVAGEGPALARTLSAVLDRVLSGYTVSGTAIRPGVESRVSLRFRPQGPVIKRVRVTATSETIHPAVRPLVLQGFDRLVAPEVGSLLLNLPVEALDWSRSLIEERAKEVVEGSLPGFTGELRLKPGEELEASVSVSPRDSRVIRDIGVRFRSSSIPLLVLDQHAPQVVSMAEPLRGLPVAFAQANRQALEELVSRQLREYPPVKQYQIIARPSLQVGETTYVTVIADSLVYRGRVEAQLNVGIQAPPAQVVAQLGRVVSPGVEVFLESALTPSPLSLRWNVGVRYDISDRVVVGAKVDPFSRGLWLWASHQLTPEVGVRSTLDLAGSGVEGAVTYRVNEFLSGELVATTSRGWWIRLVSNL